MISKRDLQLGKIALRAGMVTKEQLAKSLAIQKKLEKPVGLGAIFLKKGYISREQLEEIVKLHNEAKDKNGSASTGEKKKKKKKKSKKDKDGKEAAASSGSEASGSGTTASGSEAASGSEVKSEAPSNGSESGAAAASAPSSEEKKPEEAKKEEKKDDKKSSKTTGALKKEPDKKASTASESQTSQSDIDTALLESAPSDAGPIDETDPERRVITCQKCSKKYRIKKKQAGKKFACRKCKTKVKIPRDIFDKPAAGSASSAGAAAKNKEKSAKNPAMKVEEFSLGSGSDVGEVAKPAKGDKSEEKDKESAPTSKKPSTPTKKVSGSASAALAPAGKKSGASSAVKEGAVKEGGYGDLVKAAQEKKVTPLGPKITKGQRVMGYIQAVIFLGIVVGIGAGIWYWKHMEAVERQQKIQQQIDTEWTNVSTPYKTAVDVAKKAVLDGKAGLEKGGELPIELLRDLTTSATGLEKALAGLRPSDASQQVIQAQANIEKARALLAETAPDALVRSIYLTRARVHLAMGGESHVLEACRDCAEIVKRDPTCDEAYALLAQAELRRRNYVAAIEASKKALSLKNDPKTHAYLAVALEAGDLCKDAVKEYEALAATDPIALVFKARALLLDGDADGALGALDAAKVEGEALAAAHARRGQALERKGDLDGAAKAFEAAAAAGGKSGRAHVARGEFLLRIGKFEEAAASFDASLKESGGARAALGLGEAKAAELDGESAKRSFLQANSLPVVSSSAKLLGELDAFDDPRGPDPRATAQRRAGDLALAAGKGPEARSYYYGAAAMDSFDPESHSAIAQYEMSLKNTGAAEPQVKLARALLHSAKDHDPKVEAPPVRGTAAARCLLVEAAYWDTKGDLNAAERAIDQALVADPIAAGAPAFALKGAVLTRKGERERARNEYQKALDLEEAGKDAPSRFYNEAKAALEGAKLLRGPVEAALARAGAAEAAIRKARTALDVTLALSPRHVHALWARGRIDMLDKKWDEAIKRFTAAVDANLYFIDAYLARGFFYVRDFPDRQEGMNEAALQDFEQAIALDAQRVDAFFGRALVRRNHNDVQPTIDDLTTVIKMDSANDFAEAYMLRAEVFRRVKKDKEADSDMKKYEELQKRGGKK